MVAVDHIDIFASAVGCEAISGSAASSVCKCCKGTVSHGRLPVFYIVQTNFVNAQGKNWTGEKIIGTTGQKHIAKMPGCRVSRHPFEIGQNSTRLITVRNAFHVILIIAHIYLMSVCEFLLQSCHPMDIIK